jgi:hypothetical protein
MQQANPWDNDPVVGEAPAATPRLRFVPTPKTPTPQTPEERQHTVASTRKTELETANIVKPHVLTADEVAANPTLDPAKAWAMDASGNVKTVGDVPQPFKVGDSNAISHAWSVLDSIREARDLSGKPLATGTLSATASNIPVIGGLVGQNRANLQTKLGQISGDLRQLGIRTLYEQTGKRGVGSIARNQSEQQALQNALAPLGFVDQGGHIAPSGGAQPDASTLGQGLDTAQEIYVRHLARLYGMDPDDPAAIKSITAAIADPNLRLTFGAQAQPASSTRVGDNGITASSPLPALRGVDPEGLSGTEKAVINPQLAKIAGPLTAYLNAPIRGKGAVSNAQIIGFMQKNGVDPATTNVGQLLQMRATGKYKGFTVDPRSNVPLEGFAKARAKVSASAPASAAVGVGDAATFGAVPDVVGAVHDLTGAGPTRADIIQGRNALAAEHPLATLLGNLGGAFANPVARGGGVGRSLGLGGLYGFLGSDDPNIGSRLTNAAIGSTVAGATHGLVSGGSRLAQSGYRGGKNLILAPLVGDPEQLATNAALARAAERMPTQDVAAATAKVADLTARGAKAPAAAGLSRGGQDYLARTAASSPAARATADQAAAAFRKALPQSLATDFDQAISDLGPEHLPFVQRPAREIASDIQDMAGSEFERGITPIKGEQVTLTPELTGDLEHERVAGAIRDALASHTLSSETRNELRGLIPQLKTLTAAPEIARGAYAKGIGLSVDSARNIATALDRTAGKLADGSEGQVEMSRLSRDIRGAIAEQFPEYAPVNARYASRMRAKEALDAARRNFLGEAPEQMDALAKSATRFTDVPNEPEYHGPATAYDRSGEGPSNRQLAIAGAREAAVTRAGTGTGTGGGSTARQLAEGPNQQARNAMVMGDEAAAKLASRAGAKAEVADTIDRVTSGATGDQAAKWWQIGKKLLAYKATGGAGHLVAAHAVEAIPGMTGEDAARVVRVYLDADSADQAVASLQKAYGAKKARFIMARIAAVASAAATTRGSPK